MKTHGLWPQWNIIAKAKTLWPQWKIPSWFIAPMEKAWFYGRFPFEVLIVIVKDKTIQHKIYNVNRKKLWRKRKLYGPFLWMRFKAIEPIRWDSLFGKSNVTSIFSSIGKRLTLAKIGRGCSRLYGSGTVELKNKTQTRELRQQNSDKKELQQHVHVN